MSVGIGRQNIIILFWKYEGCTVSFHGIQKWEPEIYIGFLPALHLQCAIIQPVHTFPMGAPNPLSFVVLWLLRLSVKLNYQKYSQEINDTQRLSKLNRVWYHEVAPVQISLWKDVSGSGYSWHIWSTVQHCRNLFLTGLRLFWELQIYLLQTVKRKGTDRNI
jgi:hypothetical protein